GGGLEGGSVGAVDHQPEAGEIDGHLLHQKLDIPFVGILPAADPAHPPPHRPGPVGRGIIADGLDGQLILVGQLVAVGAEELDAVVLRWVVGGGDDRPGRQTQEGGEDGHRRGGHHPQEVDVAPGRGEPRGQGRLRQLPRRAGGPPGPPPPRSPPAEASPAARAASSISPDARVSRPIPTRGRSSPARWATTWATARPRRKANSGVNSRLATPRMPSVPKSRPTPRHLNLVPSGSPAGTLAGPESCAPYR